MKNLQTAAAILAAYFILFRTGAGIFGPIKSKSRFLPVYIDGRPNKNLIRPGNNKPGVYIIKKAGEVSYIGYSNKNVYKALTRHFQDWSSSRQTRITYPQSENITARVIYTNTATQAAKLERALIIKQKPIDNPNKYENELYSDQLDAIHSDYTRSEVEAPF